MKLKASLHFHTKEDYKDIIKYTLKEGIDKAAALGFNVLAVTCHRKFICTREHVTYARSKGLLLIPGVEADILGPRQIVSKHVVVLNCDKEIEEVRTFEKLRIYKQSHPEIFIIAAHPYFPDPSCLGKNLEKYIDLFDAIEHSWFYTEWLNYNKKAVAIAKKYDLPLVSTSDTHFFDFFDTNYIIADATEKTPASLFDAIRNRSYQNITAPRNFLKDMVWIYGKFVARNEIGKLRKRFRRVCAKNYAPPIKQIVKPIPASVHISDKTENEIV